MTDQSNDNIPHHEEPSASEESALLKRHEGVPGLDGDAEPIQKEQKEEPVIEAVVPEDSEEDVKAARRKQMLANLEKGRKTAMENRRKRALLKKLEKEEKQLKIESDLKAKLNAKQTQEDEVTGLKEEITRLKAEATGRNEGLKEQELQRLKEELKKLKSSMQKPSIAREPKQRAKEPSNPKVNEPLHPRVHAKPNPVQPEVEVYRTFAKAPW